MIAPNDDERKISVRIESGSVDREHARCERRSMSDGALVDRGDPGSPPSPDGDIAVDADVEMGGSRPRADHSSATGRFASRVEPRILSCASVLDGSRREWQGGGPCIVLIRGTIGE
jgi:hypothetical protein